MYTAWGEFVADRIRTDVAVRIQPADIDAFLKIPITSRTKLDKTLLDKAFYRNKPYANPYEDIEDKVGARVVILFREDVRVVEEVVQACEIWDAKKARDYDEESMLRPYEFDYQSLHYIVRAHAGLSWQHIAIDAGTPCEVQIRTLLQHAYSELTHDTIYKPSVAADPSVKRAAAKSMALIEATGDYFSEVRNKLALAAAPGDKVAAEVERIYVEHIGMPEISALNSMIIDHYKKWSKEDFRDQIVAYYQEKSWLFAKVAERATTSALYRQPGVLLVYWAIDQAPTASEKNSPLTKDELAPIYSDLGKNLP